MGADEKRLIEVCRLLNQYKAKYLVVGGMACNLHGLIRATKDIDLLIPKDVDNTERVIEALSEIGFGMARELIAEEVVKKPFTIIGDIPRIDLITVANKIKYEQAAPTALKETLDHVTIPYVDYENLVKSKQTSRLQDRADIETLERIKKGK
jgi:hypothetical protein